MSDIAQGTPGGDDTAAFQKFYESSPPERPRGWVYRLFVGWWRDRT